MPGTDALSEYVSYDVSSSLWREALECSTLVYLYQFWFCLALFFVEKCTCCSVFILEKARLEKQEP